ncbi:MAG: hypothetical protein HY804_08735 [Nitrospinae bacterium]|nr:hypothetical protein [Nitrospinota bacterium]
MARLLYSEANPPRTLLTLFAIVILLGAALLSLPIATHHGIGFLDALFTATSAVCVTGLMTVDPGTVFTPFGQLVILALIQVGGLGIMTFSTFFMVLLRRSLTLPESAVIFDTLDPNRRLRIGELLKQTMTFTFSVEAVGALVLFVRWAPEHGAADAAWLAVFHSVAAFCNAGISLFPDNLMRYSGDVVVNAVVMALIVTGGLGFLTLAELRLNYRARRSGKRPPVSANCQLTLAVTGALIVTGTALIFVFERNHGLAGMAAPHQAMAALFQSVTARTAGFNTVDLNGFTNASLYVILLLMFVGAAPGSTGGGVKVTTFGAMIALIWSRLRARERVEIFHRAIAHRTMSQALFVFFLAAQILVLFALALFVSESAGSGPAAREAFLPLLFETVSAFGTVGLSLGATANLTEPGKILVIALMYIGRLGALTMIMAAARRAPHGAYRYAEEEITIG